MVVNHERNFRRFLSNLLSKFLELAKKYIFIIRGRSDCFNGKYTHSTICYAFMPVDHQILYILKMSNPHKRL